MTPFLYIDICLEIRLKVLLETKVVAVCNGIISLKKVVSIFDPCLPTDLEILK